MKRHQTEWKDAVIMLLSIIIGLLITIIILQSITINEYEAIQNSFYLEDY